MSLPSDQQDRAIRLQLPQVTLFAATSVAGEATIRALRASMAGLRFGAVKFFSHHDLPGRRAAEIEFVKIRQLASRQDYSRFVLKELAAFIQTPFALCIQWDGFVIRPEAWHAEFLEYDYIGAPWPQFQDGWNVGNGGFSLRSLRLLRATTDDRVPVDAAEDVIICRHARPVLEADYGIRFADSAVAARFAFERNHTQDIEFGFHGVFNLPRTIGRRNFRNLVAGLEPGLINPKDARQLLTYALSGVDIRLFMAMIIYCLRNLWSRKA